MLADLLHHATVGGSDSTLIVAIGSSVGSALLMLIAQLVLRRQTKDQLIAEASEEMIGGAKVLLADYRQELASAKAELKELRERVARLEKALELATKELERGAQERARLERERERAVQRLTQVQERVAELEHNLELLGGGPPEERKDG